MQPIASIILGATLLASASVNADSVGGVRAIEMHARQAGDAKCLEVLDIVTVFKEIPTPTGALASHLATASLSIGSKDDVCVLATQIPASLQPEYTVWSSQVTSFNAMATSKIVSCTVFMLTVKNMS